MKKILFLLPLLLFACSKPIPTTPPPKTVKAYYRIKHYTKDGKVDYISPVKSVEEPVK